jgi:hypothetical protein
MTVEEFKTADALVMKIHHAEKIEEQLKATIAKVVAIPADEDYSICLNELRLQLTQAVSQVIADYAKTYRDQLAAI